LCDKAKALPVAVAALCVRPAFVAAGKRALAGSGIKVATVINFPDASTSAEQVGLSTDAAAQVALTSQAVRDGADEIDLVFAWGAFQMGDAKAARACIEQVKAASGHARLKVILESGAFADLKLLRAACELAVDAGADFLKTSTGVYPQGASAEAARVLCEVSRDYSKSIGVKISGGVRTPEQAQQYLDIAADVLGLSWITPDNFRIGASKLVENLLSAAAPSKQAVGY
jgi:deoxyribose-phosphate aldolase